MSDPKAPTASDSEPARPSAKRPYESPRIVESAEFETLAMACAKQVDQPFQCGSMPNSG